MSSAKPTPSVLREMSDETVLRVLMNAPRLTRAEIAAATSLSKPTAAEAIRRLEAIGLVCDTGERTSGRGGIGRYYALSSDVGVALAVSIAPTGIVAECVDTAGHVLGRRVESVGRPASPNAVARILVKAARAAARDVAASVRVAVVSAADPVDRTTGSLVHLPDAPFLLGELSPGRTLAPLVEGPVIVDNDVNWEARAEREARYIDSAPSPDNFVYLHLGEGLGCAVVGDGEVRRGHSGLAGEIAHLIVTGAGGRAVTFTTVFDQLDLRHAGSTAIDVGALLARTTAPDDKTVPAVAVAVCDAITAAIGLADPQLVVIGGEWGTDPAIYAALRTRMRSLPRSVPLDLNRGGPNSAQDGVRSTAVERLRADIVGRAQREA